MKAIILAAGKGTRLMPLTQNKPKCLVEFHGKAILDYTLEALRANDVTDVTIVTGYCAESVIRKNVKTVMNAKYAETNMVHSLFKTESEWNDDIIVSYSDIIYSSEVLRRLIQSEHGISVVADRAWRSLWELRMDDPLSDAETFKVSANGTIKELGKKAKTYDDIEAQYIGLFKIKKDVLPALRRFYSELDRAQAYDGKSFDQMFMTTFLQLIIDRLMPIYPVFIEGGWLEIDSLEDFHRLSRQKRFQFLFEDCH